MKNSNEKISLWEDKGFLQEYASESRDPQIGWYEFEVNMPSIISLFPENPRAILDFGTGSGKFADILSEKFISAKVFASDTAQAIPYVKTKNAEKITWDGLTPFPKKEVHFDIIVAKLVFPFIKEDDLEAVLNNFYNQLNPEGRVVISVFYPETIRKKHDIPPGADNVVYQDMIGSTGLSISPHFRTKKWCVDIFNKAGFVLCGSDSPLPSQEVIEAHNLDSTQSTTRKRLNLCFKKMV